MTVVAIGDDSVVRLTTIGTSSDISQVNRMRYSSSSGGAGVEPRATTVTLNGPNWYDGASCHCYCYFWKLIQQKQQRQQARLVSLPLIISVKSLTKGKTSSNFRLSLLPVLLRFPFRVVILTTPKTTCKRMYLELVPSYHDKVRSRS